MIQMLAAGIAAAVILGVLSALFAAAVVYFVGWREERRTTEARVQRRLRELRHINRDPGQGAGA